MQVGSRAAALGLALAGALLAAQASAEPKPAPPAAAASAAAAAQQPPHAEDVLRAMSKFLAAQRAFSYHGELEYDQILPGGPKIRLAGAVDVAVARPGSLYVDYRDDVSDRVVWLQDGTLTLFDPVADTWAQVSGPKDTDGMVAKLEKEYGVSLPLGELSESDPYAALTQGVDQAHYVGVHNVEGVYCHHLLLQRPDLDLQVWVVVGDQPVPRKLVFEYPDRPGSPSYEVSITDWHLEAPKPGLFAPKVPKDAGRVGFLPIGEGR
jgi:hypothetical protein